MIMDQDLIYKTINSPKYLKKTLLTTAISFIEIIQQEGRIEKIREEKQKVMQMLTEEIKNTNHLLNHFQELLPKTKLEKERIIKEPQHFKMKKQIEIKPSKLDSLQQELFDLKNKLDRI